MENTEYFWDANEMQQVLIKVTNNTYKAQT